MKRPLGGVIIGFAAGIVLGDQLPVPAVPWLGTGLLLVSLCLTSDRWRARLLPLLLVVAGAAGLTVHKEVISPIELRRVLPDEPLLLTARGTVERVELRASTDRRGIDGLRTSARLRVEAVRMDEEWRPVHGWMQVSAPATDAPLLRTGQRVEVFGVGERPPEAFAPGLFDYRAHLARRGVHHQLRFEGPADVLVLDEKPFPLPERFRAWAMATLQRGLPEGDETVGLVWAMTVGWRTSLTDEVAEPFMRSGTMHLFAISGLHVGLIAGIIVALLRLVRVPREWVGCGVIPLLWFFTAVTGWQASAVRATIMMSVVVLGWSLRRPVDLLNSLSVAALVILIWDPRQLFHAGFQLSFAVVASIGLLLPPLERLRQRLLRTDPLLPPELRPRWQRRLDAPVRFVTVSFAVSLAAWLGSLPLIMHYFHLITPVGILANVVVVQLGSLALAAALGSLLTAPFVPLCSELFNHSAWFFTTAMADSSTWFGGWPYAWLNVRSPPLVSTIAYYALLWWIVSGGVMRHRWFGVPVALVCAATALIAWRWNQSGTRLTVLPLNGGHALYLEGPASGNWLIDCGDESNWRYHTRPFLQARGLNRLDHLILTHGDVRHLGAATNVFAEFRPREVILNPLPQRSRFQRQFEQLLDESGHDPVRPAIGEETGPWTILHPDVSDTGRRADTTALVLRLKRGPATIVHVPDLDADGWRRLSDRGPDLRADIVIVSPSTDPEELARNLQVLSRPSVLIVVDSHYPAGERFKPELKAAMRPFAGEVFFTTETGALELLFNEAGLPEVQTSSGN